MTDTEKRAMYTMWAALPGQAHERHHTKGEMKEKKRIVCVQCPPPDRRKVGAIAGARGCVAAAALPQGLDRASAHVEVARALALDPRAQGRKRRGPCVPPTPGQRFHIREVGVDADDLWL